MSAGPINVSDQTVILDEGRLFISRQWLEIFSYSGLDSFRAIFDHPGHGVAKRALDHRFTLKLKLEGPGGAGQLFYIKKYLARPGEKPGPQAQAEWNSMWWFLEEGIAGPEPVALGVDWEAAFVISRAVPNVMKLDEWAERHLASRGAGHQGQERQTGLLDRVICEVATIAGRMHRAGMCHQDLYLCHFLCASERQAIPLTLIDLQRVRRFPGKLPLGRQVKDLGQLLFSAQRFIGPQEIRRFWQLYREANPQNSIPGPLMLPMVRLKAARIGRHTKRHGL